MITNQGRRSRYGLCFIHELLQTTYLFVYAFGWLLFVISVGQHLTQKLSSVTERKVENTSRVSDRVSSSSSLQLFVLLWETSADVDVV